MANIFLASTNKDIETAILLEKAIVHDIGNAVAYTDGEKTFVNTDDNLFKILPAYDHKMLKWLLWHERYHQELRHHNRFFRYLEELDDKKLKDKFHLSKDEVNIIMDILVHDSLAKLFPELVETAVNNLAQMRNRNSLKYTFETATLEEMLEEYRNYKKDGEKSGKPKRKEIKEGEGEDEADSELLSGEGESDSEEESKDDKPKDDKGKADSPKGHKDGGDGSSEEDDKKDKSEHKEPKLDEDAPEPEPTPEPEHDKTDWSKLEQIDPKEFITAEESKEIMTTVNRLKRKKFKLGKLTETLNGLVTSTRQRTYSRPCSISVGGGAILKGSKPGRTKLYLCFDASGSMGRQMETFKEIISKSIPQAMDTPTAWFSGEGERVRHDPEGRSSDYYKGKFKDFMPVTAYCGYSDDGDRTIELCWKAEQLGYSPIGVTDGGGRISWATDMLKQLKRTVFVGQDADWLKEAKRINPKIQILDV